MREEGKLRFIGVSGYPLRIFREVLDRTDIDTIITYCRYTLIDTSLLELLPYLEAKGVGIINASPFAMGLLTDSPPPSWHPAPKEVQDACRKAAELAGDRLPAMALRFAVDNPNISSTLVGMSSTDQLKKNLTWLREAEAIEILKPVHNLGW